MRRQALYIGRKWGLRTPLIVIVLMLAGITADAAFSIFGTIRPPVATDPAYYQYVLDEEKVVALTFDDGPDPQNTPKILETLKKHDVPATFFLLGSSVLKHPEIVQQIDREGFEIGNHTFTHAEDIHSSRLRLRTELNATNRLIESLIHKQTLLYRPPYLLDIGPDSTSTPDVPSSPLLYANASGYIPVGADLDPQDWKATDPNQIIAGVLSDLRPDRHLILLHDGPPSHNSVEALDGLILALKERGYRFVEASALMGLDAPARMHVTHDLGPGSKDVGHQKSVHALQMFLQFENYTQRPPTGVYDEQTGWLVAAWQAEHGVHGENGRVGPATRAAIQKRLAAFKLPSDNPSPRIASFYSPLPAIYLYKGFSALVGKTGTLVTTTVMVLILLRLGMVVTLTVLARRYPRKRVAPWSGPVSILVPAYNEEDNIRGTLSSIFKSDYHRFEVIVIDDGSTDETREIVRSLQKTYGSRLLLLSVPNGGKANALNHGIAHSQYSVVVTMDADTIFNPGTVSHLVKDFNDPAVTAVAGQVRATHTRSILNVFQSLEYVISQNVDKRGMSFVNAIGVVPGPVGAWRKQAVLDAGGYKNDTLVEDQDLTMTLLSRGHRVLYEPRAVAYTETPFSFRDFLKQRFRWVYGSVQCLWKFRRFWFTFKNPNFGWGVLGHGLVYAVILPLLSPLIDLLLFLAIIFGVWSNLISVFFLFLLLDLFYAMLAYQSETNRRWVLLMLPFQRFLYRIVLWLVVTLAVVKALDGSGANWNKVRKRGDAVAQLEYLEAQ